MPVLVAPAATPLGEATVLRLLREGGEVRAYGGDARLRAAGAILASGDLDDPGRLEAALEQVHTVVHLGVSLLGEAAAIRRAGEILAFAAANAGVRRVVALSVPGADPGASDPLRQAAGHLEATLAGAGVPTVILRPSLVDTAELRDALATAPLDASSLATRVAPVRPQDLIELVAAFDALRSTAHEGHVVFGADGPEEMSLGDYLDRVALIRSGEGGRYVGRVYRPPGSRPLLLSSAVAGPWTSTLGPALFDAWSFAAVTPEPVGSA